MFNKMLNQKIMPMVAPKEEIMSVFIELLGFGNDVIISVCKKPMEDSSKALFSYSRQFAAKRLPVFS